MKKKRNLKKRWLAFLMAAALIAAMLPATVMADTENGSGAGTDGVEITETQDEATEDSEQSDSDAAEGEENEATGEDKNEEPVSGSIVLGTTQDNDANTTAENSTDTAISVVQALINALPDAEDITEDNADEVGAALDAIDEAKIELLDMLGEGVELTDVLDFDKYDAAIAVLDELNGQAGAGGEMLLTDENEFGYGYDSDGDGTSDSWNISSEDNSNGDVVYAWMVLNDAVANTYTLHIAGTGAMVDYSTNNPMPWHAVDGEIYKNITSIEFGAGVTTIGYAAFMNFTSLTSVNFAANSQLTEVHDTAFAFTGNNTGSLEMITFPSKVKSIGGSAFWLSSIQSVQFEDASSLVTISGAAFGRCTNLIKFNLNYSRDYAVTAKNPCSY